MAVFRTFALAALAVVWAGAAQAGLKFCNDTDFVQSVSIGYQGDEDWTSEGWWNVDPGDCATTIPGDLKWQYYYYRAEVDGGDFDGENYFFCTSPQVYTIVGDADCESRGYDKERFREIDVGQGVTDYTMTLVSDSGSGTPQAPEAAVDLGLVVCNETGHVQSVSIGYEGDEGWTSEGWWNVDPDACATVIGRALDKRYYYYRAEIEGGPFDGEGYFFCTSPKEYTIVGDTDCEARGYDREDFAEVDVGRDVDSYRLTIVPDAALTRTAETAEAPDGAETETGLNICNDTATRQEVSIGWQRGADWVSKGWWNIDPGDCAKVLGGDLEQQYYYYRAEVGGGPFEGGGYSFCTTPEAYEIVGDTDCEARGYDNEDFAEIDIGSGTTAYTFSLTGGAAASAGGPPLPVTEPAATPGGAEGLRICNATPQVQSVAIGYQDEDGNWISEGWWNLNQDQCATVIGGVLQKRYFYYRTEVDGGPFEGEGYGFCTTPEEFTIVGDTDCEARGYEREDFAEIDTGPTAKHFLFTISGAAAPVPSEPELFEERDTDGGADPEAVPQSPTAPLPEPAPEPDPDPDPEPEIAPAPDPEPPATPRRGGSRG